MTAGALAASWGRVLGLGLLAFAGDEAGPPPDLAPPAELPSVAVPRLPDEPAPAIPAPAGNGPQPVLVVPGLPTVRPGANVPRFEPVVPPSEADLPPPLTGPAGAGPGIRTGPPSFAPRYSPRPATAPPAAGGLSLEPGVLEPYGSAAPGVSVPAGPGTPRSLAPRPGSSLPPPRSTPPPRRGLFFGLFGRPQPLAPRIDDDPIRVEPRSDPAADAALKRRLEQQIRAQLGGQLRSLDVRVIDRNVFITARVLRFWQKRGVRRTIEGLPALSGYQARVDVIE